jgi:hypothetical protein
MDDDTLSRENSFDSVSSYDGTIWSVPKYLLIRSLMKKL